MRLVNWVRGAGRTVHEMARRFAVSTRGNVAMIFALTLPILVLVTVGGVDINRASTVRLNLQDALDAASLAAARSSYVTDADLTRVGTAALKANLQAYPNITLGTATFTLNAQQIVIADATVNVKTLVANIVLPPYGKFLDDTLPVKAHSEVNRSSKNIEVALVLDITGSMSGSKIVDLKAAAVELVDIVVKDQQTPYYTKMSVIPYSIGVNVGTYANAARGSLTQSRSISGASWMTGSQKSVGGISRANPGVITSNSHGFANNDFVWISGVASSTSGSGTNMTTLNDRAYRVKGVATNSFTLESWNGSSWVAVSTSAFKNYASGGIIRKCQVSDCSVVITSNSHGIAAGEGVYITGVGGMTQINNLPFEAANVTTNTFSIGVNGASYGNYTSGGLSWCGRDQCQYRVFRNASNAGLTVHNASTCVSERTGAQAYTDASPSSAPVGRNYASTANPCPTATMMPLSTSRSSLKTLINGLTITGSTAGQIGLAWGWYTLLPNFNTLWPSSPAGVNVPANTLKAVILMTDGAFNTPYCGGVIAANAGTGSGSAADHINCNATQGDPFAQARALCTAIKAQQTVIYTVGFEVGNDAGAASVLADCASGPSYAFLPDSGEDLSEAFAAIGRDITQLRISR